MIALLSQIDEDMLVLEMDRDKARSQCNVLEEKCAILEKEKADAKKEAVRLQVMHQEESSQADKEVSSSSRVHLLLASIESKLRGVGMCTLAVLGSIVCVYL